MSTNTKEYMRKWRQDHLQEKNEYNKLWAREHKEQFAKYRTKYNRDPIVVQKRREQEKLKYQNDLEYREHRKKIWQRSHKKNKERVLNYRKTHTSPNQQWRLSYDYIKWQKEIYKKHNYKCQICGDTHTKDKLLHAHHIKQAKDFPELRYDINNGMCLCNKCHLKTHLEQRQLPI